jgi:hypothetical protein
LPGERLQVPSNAAPGDMLAVSVGDVVCAAIPFSDEPMFMPWRNYSAQYKPITEAEVIERFNEGLANTPEGPLECDDDCEEGEEMADSPIADLMRATTAEILAKGGRFTDHVSDVYQPAPIESIVAIGPLISEVLDEIRADPASIVTVFERGRRRMFRIEKADDERCNRAIILGDLSCGCDGCQRTRNKLDLGGSAIVKVSEPVDEPIIVNG